MRKEEIQIKELFPYDYNYIETRFNDLRIRLLCNVCGYRFFSQKKYSIMDNLEGYDELIDGVRCPNCGSDDVEEI